MSTDQNTNPTNTSPPDSPNGSTGGGSGFPSWAAPAATAATVFAPFISLIVGGAMLSGEQDPARKSFLKTWVIASAVWLAIGGMILIAVVASSGIGGSDCKGGIDRFSLPTYQSNDGKHWTATYDCYNGGTKTINVPASKVPGGGN